MPRFVPAIHALVGSAKRMDARDKSGSKIRLHHGDHLRRLRRRAPCGYHPRHCGPIGTEHWKGAPRARGSTPEIGRTMGKPRAASIGSEAADYRPKATKIEHGTGATAHSDGAIGSAFVGSGRRKVVGKTVCLPQDWMRGRRDASTLNSRPILALRVLRASADGNRALLSVLPEIAD